MGEQPLWGQFWRAPQLSSAHSNILVAARIKIHAMLTKLGESNKHFSLIHADLHPYNMLFDDGRIQLIDFDDCGYGWHMYDIAVALYNYRNHERFIDIRDALAVGYRSLRPLSGSALSLLPMFFLIRALVWLGWINARPELRDDEQVQQHVASLIAQSQEFLARDTDAPDTDAPDTDAPNTDG
jgi:Ser/Thr protein kinase RdoA (MazF antagonist)